MTDALTGSSWLSTFKRLMTESQDETTSALAAMLYDIVGTSNDPKIDQIIDAYALTLLERNG